MAPVLCGHIPQVMAALRNTAIGLLRFQGYTNMAAVCRQVAAQPASALARMGMAWANAMTLRKESLAVPSCTA
jgi:hypothetical protein